MSDSIDSELALREFRAREAQQVSLIWLLGVMLRERRIIALLVVAGAIAAVAFASLKPAKFTTEFSFMPEEPNEGGGGALAGLAGQFGIALPGGAQKSSPQLYADILKTRSLLSELAVDSFSRGGEAAGRRPLHEFLRAKGGDPAERVASAVERLREKVMAVSVAARTTGVVTVRVKTEDPQLSFEVARRTLEKLNAFNIASRQTQASAERKFTEERLRSASEDLRTAEDRLKAFLQGNRDLAGSPSLTFGRDRLERDVESVQQVVTSLRQRYEDARIREVRDTPVISVIERPTLAAKADRRGRALALLSGAGVGLLLGLAYALLRDVLGRGRAVSDPGVELLLTEWRGLRGKRG